MSLGLALGFYALLRLANLPLLPPAKDLAATDRGAVLIYVGISFVSTALKMIRWQAQLDPIAKLSRARVLSANFLGNAALVLLPFRTGEVVRPSLIARGGEISFFAAAATTVAERLIDALMVGAMLLGCLRVAPMLSPLPDHVGSLPISAAVIPTLGYAASALALTFSLFLAAFYAFRRPATRLIRRHVGRFSPRLATWLEHKLLDACRGLEFLTIRRFGVPFTIFSVGYWLTFWGGTWYILRASGFTSMSLAQAGVVAGTLAFGLAGPNAPGYFGSFQAAVYGSLALFFPTPMVVSHGAVAVFWLYVVNLGWLLALVPVALWMQRQSRVRQAVATPS